MEQTTKLIKGASIEQIDALWAILKYRELGVYKKLLAMACVLRCDPQVLISEAPKEDDSDRILSSDTRYAIHAPLLERSFELNGK